MSKMLTKMQVLIIKRYTLYQINKEKFRGFFWNLIKNPCSNLIIVQM